MSGTGRTLYRGSMAAFFLALPAAIAIHGWGPIQAWRAAHGNEVAVAAGETASQAGGRWRLTHLRRLAGDGPGGAVLVELEATVDDPAALTAQPCMVEIRRARGRRWKRTFLHASEVREMHPEAAERPRCGPDAFKNAAAGQTVRIAESFTLPRDAQDLTVTVAFPQATSEVLAFSPPSP